MNREILFKAKRKDNGKWVEGYYIYHIKRTICPFGDSIKPEDEQHVIMQDDFSDWNMPRNTVVYEIDTDTLCQYTGLTDKNDKKIWENDIVKVSTNKGNTLCEARYADNVAQFQLWQFTTLPRTATVLNLGNYEEKVIGNIFDNPELLEGERC